MTSPSLRRRRARSPTPCSTRATCSTRTGRAPARTSRRWQFGVLGPPGAAEAGASARTRRWRLQLPAPPPGRRRELHRPAALPAAAEPRGPARRRSTGIRPGARPVRRVDGSRLLSWDEAVEREVTLSRPPRLTGGPGRRDVPRWTSPAVRTSPSCARAQASSSAGWSGGGGRSPPRCMWRGPRSQAVDGVLPADGRGSRTPGTRPTAATRIEAIRRVVARRAPAAAGRTTAASSR